MEFEYLAGRYPEDVTFEQNVGKFCCSEPLVSYSPTTEGVIPERTEETEPSK